VKVTLTTRLAARPEKVWDEVQTSRLLEHVAAPLVRFRAVQPAQLPTTWADGSYEVQMLLFGWLPAGRQVIRISRFVSDTTRVLRDDGSGQLATVWDHTIRVEPSSGGGTEYTDIVEVRAGFLTLIVWAFAQVFYRHRQRRWRALVARGFDYGS
jgi:hypothetical protein